MNRNQAEQIARIIYNVFEHEEQVDPRTVAKMFQYMGRLGNSESLDHVTISYYHCGHCLEDVAMDLECPCCGINSEYVCKHESQTPEANYAVHMCVKCNEEFCR